MLNIGCVNVGSGLSRLGDGLALCGTKVLHFVHLKVTTVRMLASRLLHRLVALPFPSRIISCSSIPARLLFKHEEIV